MKSHSSSLASTAPMITGKTALVGILADPITHVQTPQRLNAWFRDHGHDAILVPMHVGASDLASLVQNLRKVRNLAGFVVTVPHKEAFAPLCDQLGEEASMVGAVNAVKRLSDGGLLGENFDGAGFVGGLRAAGIDPKGHDVLMAGAGGAARAIGFALARAEVASLSIFNRNHAKADALAQAIRSRFPTLPIAAVSDPATEKFSLIVNATSLGLSETDPLPVPAALLRRGTTVAEVIMKPERTKLLDVAAEHGCRVHPGRHMLEAQIELLGSFVLAGIDS